MATIKLTADNIYEICRECNQIFSQGNYTSANGNFKPDMEVLCDNDEIKGLLVNLYNPDAEAASFRNGIFIPLYADYETDKEVPEVEFRWNAGSIYSLNFTEDLMFFSGKYQNTGYPVFHLRLE